MDGFVQGAEAVRTVLVYIRSLYDYQRAHGFLFQHHAEFAADVTEFLTAAT